VDNGIECFELRRVNPGGSRLPFHLRRCLKRVIR
jgi:hypothetical protein